MFDTLTMFLKQDHYKTSQALYGLSDVQEHSRIDTGEIWHTGKQENIRVKVQDSGLSANGSIAKYFLGNNAETLTRETTRQAIEKLSDDLHLPMKEALIYRLDVGQNFIVQEPIITYLTQLGEAKYFERGTIKKNKGLLYTNGHNAISFYDKISDLKRHKEPIPCMYQGRNVLRYERRWRGRIAKQFKQPSITGSLLYDETFYYMCLEKWKQDFISIHKRQLPTNEVNMNGTKEFMLSLALLSVQHIGEDYLIETIKAQQKCGAINKKTARDLRIKLKEITRVRKNDSKNSNIMQELETKVSQTVHYYT